LIAIRGTESHPEQRKVIEGPIKSVLRKQPRKLFKHLQNLRVSHVETTAGIYVGRALTFELDVRRFFRVAKKIVKGLYFCKIGKPLAKDYVASIIWDNPNTQAAMRPLFQHLKKTANFGDDAFIYNWLVDPRDDRTSFWFLGFYKAVSLYGLTHSSEPLPIDSTQAELNIPVVKFWQ
jgi:hypothetical protein